MKSYFRCQPFQKKQLQGLTSEIACESGQAEQVHIRVLQMPQPQQQAENLLSIRKTIKLQVCINYT